MPPDSAKKPRSIWSAIGHAIKALFEWIPEHLGDPALAAEIRGDLGLKPDAQLPEDKAAKFRQFAAGLDPDKESFAETVAEIGDVAAEIAVLKDLLESDDDQAMVQLTYVLLSLAATDSVRIRVPAVYSTARALLFLAQDVESLVAIDPARLLRQLRGEDLPSGEAMAQRIAFAGALVLQLLDGLIDGKDNPESADPEKPGHVDIFSGWDLAPESVTPKADLLLLRATTFDIGRVDGTGGRLFATILYVPPEHGGPGVFLSLGGALELDRVIGQTHVKFEAGVGDGFNLFIPIGDDAMDTAAQVLGDPVPFLRLTAGAGKPDEPALRIGDPDSTRLDIYETELAVEVRADDAAVRAAVRNAELVVVPGSEDGFLAAIVGDGAKVRLTLGFIADSKGFRLDGGTKLSATLPVGRSIAGLLTVHHVEIALGPSSTGGDLGLEVSGAFTATLGPFTAVVDRLGFRLDLDRREDANLGLFHVEPSFKPPSGIGLRLDAGVVKGGGYLFTDPANHEYAGALELEVFSWTVKAIGVLTHRPGGGWSLLLFVYAQFPPYPLPFGFTLNGIGGLAGVQHGVDLVQLSAGMKTKAFDDILFPADPVGDAPRIINRLRTLFPVTPRALTIGLMVDIGYGTPRFLYIRLGIIVQADNVFGSGTGDFAIARIVLIGQVKVALGPTKSDPDQAVVRLIVDILGFWDWADKRYGFMARLRDSRLGPVDVTGGLGVFGEYGAHPRFILAAGGFNPRFKDVPAEMGGALDRLGAGFKVGSAELKITGYFAITPGTVQAGLDVSAKGKVGPVGFKGSIGFDVIVHHDDDRTHFIADFHVTLRDQLQGTHPVVGEGGRGARGAGRLARRREDHLLDPVVGRLEALDRLVGRGPAAQRDHDRRPRVAGRRARQPIELVGAAAVCPASRWRPWPRTGARPRRSPTRSGGSSSSSGSCRSASTSRASARVASAGPNRFDPIAVTVGGHGLTPPLVQEHFARAQFVEMSDDEKLTRPSFEALDAGVAFSSEAFTVPSVAIGADMDFEPTAYLDLDPARYNRTRRDPSLRGAATDHGIIGALALLGAAARAPMRDDERITAHTAARVDVEAAPLVAVADDTFVPAADVLVPRAEMTAEQQLPLGTLLVEAFELAVG